MTLLATIEKLRHLRDQADYAPVFHDDYKVSTKWVQEVTKAITCLLGEDHKITKDMEKIEYSLPSRLRSGAVTSDDPVRLSGLGRLRGLVDDALEAVQSHLGAEPIDERSFDTELWQHVSSLMEHQDWGKVPSAVAIFVEDKVRKLSGGDRSLLGKGLFAKAMGNTGVLRLGSQAGEHEGWRGLGMGLAQAIGNVDRHHVQDRDDARKYALGVLGLGSLILTQVHHQYPSVANGNGTKTTMVSESSIMSGADFSVASIFRN